MEVASDSKVLRVHSLAQGSVQGGVLLMGFEGVVFLAAMLKVGLEVVECWRPYRFVLQYSMINEH